MPPDVPHAFFAEPPASTPQECRRRTAECLRVRTSLDSTNKALLLEMAQEGLGLPSSKWPKLLCPCEVSKQPRLNVPLVDVW